MHEVLKNGERVTGQQIADILKERWDLWEHRAQFKEDAEQIKEDMAKLFEEIAVLGEPFNFRSLPQETRHAIYQLGFLEAEVVYLDEQDGLLLGDINRRLTDLLLDDDGNIPLKFIMREGFDDVIRDVREHAHPKEIVGFFSNVPPGNCIFFNDSEGNYAGMVDVFDWKDGRVAQQVDIEVIYPNDIPSPA